MSKFNCDIVELDEVLEKYQVKDLNDLDSRLSKDHELSVMKKALELTCSRLVKSNCKFCKFKDYQECPPNYSCKDGTIEYFVDEAKEMLKDVKD